MLRLIIGFVLRSERMLPRARSSPRRAANAPFGSVTGR